MLRTVEAELSAGRLNGLEALRRGAVIGRQHCRPGITGVYIVMPRNSSMTSDIAISISSTTSHGLAVDHVQILPAGSEHSE